MDDYLDQPKYINEWNPKAYLNSFFCDPVKFNGELKHTVDFYSTFEDNSLTVLDYSGGPSLLRMIIAAPKAKKIVFSDFLQQNREEIRTWLNGSPGAFDWKPAIEHCLKLEGSPVNEDKILERESLLREKIRAVVTSDITAGKFIEEGYEGPYDVVCCTGVLDAICQMKEQFVKCVKKLSTMVKKGGYLIITTDNSEKYDVSDAEFITPFWIEPEEIEEIFNAEGINLVTRRDVLTFAVTTLSIGHKA